MWWECEKVQRFWKLIFKELTDIFVRDIEFNPEIALLSIFVNVEYGMMTRELITNLLTAARLIIARNWKSNLNFKWKNGTIKYGTLL